MWVRPFLWYDDHGRCVCSAMPSSAPPSAMHRCRQTESGLGVLDAVPNESIRIYVVGQFDS
jgi:hypothetical protein